MVEPTFTALSRPQLEELMFDVAKAAVKAALKESLPEQEPEKPGPGEAQFLTKKQAAHKLGCSPSTVDNHARAGRLTRHYLGKKVVFKLEEVLALPKPAENE